MRIKATVGRYEKIMKKVLTTKYKYDKLIIAKEIEK